MTEKSESRLVINKRKGDVTGDGIIDEVYLVGNKQFPPPSPFINNIRIIIRDGATGREHVIELKDNAGYNPNIILGSFTNKNIDDIFVSIDSGGSGGYGFYYLYSFLDNKERVLFDTDKFNDDFKYEVKYKNNYKVEITNTTLRKLFIIDISNKSKEYLSDLYETDGKLKKPIDGDVLFLNNLYPVDITGDGIYDLFALNRVIGLYGADTLGNIETPLYWDEKAFTLIGNMQYISIPGQDI